MERNAPCLKKRRSEVHQPGFDATVATVNFIVIAFNLMSLNKQAVVNDTVRLAKKQ